MFRRTWWTRRRIAVGAVATALLVAVVVWECGSDELHEGQSLEEAKAVLWKAGGVERECGMHSTMGQHYQVNDSYWELPDGRTLFLVGTRERDDSPFRVERFNVWQGWYKSDNAVELPATDSVRFRRSVLVFVPHFLR